MINWSILPKNPKKPSRKITFEVACKIWELYLAGHFKNRIAAALDINSARVNEVISGERFPEARPY